MFVASVAGDFLGGLRARRICSHARFAGCAGHRRRPGAGRALAYRRSWRGGRGGARFGRGRGRVAPFRHRLARRSRPNLCGRRAVGGPAHPGVAGLRRNRRRPSGSNAMTISPDDDGLAPRSLLGHAATRRRCRALGSLAPPVLARASIVTPGDWTELDLDPATRHASIRRAVRQAVGARQVWHPTPSHSSPCSIARPGGQATAEPSTARRRSSRTQPRLGRNGAACSSCPSCSRAAAHASLPLRRRTMRRSARASFSQRSTLGWRHVSRRRRCRFVGPAVRLHVEDGGDLRAVHRAAGGRDALVCAHVHMPLSAVRASHDRAVRCDGRKASRCTTHELSTGSLVARASRRETANFSLCLLTFSTLLSAIRWLFQRRSHARVDRVGRCEHC